MNKNAYIVASILVGALIVVGVIFFGTKREQYSSPSVKESKSANEATVNIGISQGTESAQPSEGNVTVTVSYTDDGFMPRSVSINLGDTVKWVNESNRGMWVASVVHPTHEVYPEFDQLKSVDKGGIYSFTFTKAGEWKYHNHVGPSDTGVVVVE